MAEATKSPKEEAKPLTISGNGKTEYVCKRTCYHQDTYYTEGDRVIPPDGGSLPAEYFEKN